MLCFRTGCPHNDDLMEPDETLHPMVSFTPQGEERRMRETISRWWRKVWPEPQGCLACGLCCELYGGYLHASQADLDRWRQLNREDLLALVGPSDWIWIDPQHGRRGQPCPFLQRSDSHEARCGIHQIKPDMCRDYPSLDHGRHCVRGIYIPLSSPSCQRKKPAGNSLN
jgi:Fe-S-cluster containining protein